jgi:hypothetical protein
MKWIIDFEADRTFAAVNIVYAPSRLFTDGGNYLFDNQTRRECDRRAPRVTFSHDTSSLAVFETRLRSLTKRGVGVSECKHEAEKEFQPVLCGA